MHGPIQQVTFTGTGTSFSITIAAPAKGNSLVVCIVEDFAVSLTVTSSGSAWFNILLNNLAVINTQVWIGQNSDGVETSISITASLSCTICVNVTEWEGLYRPDLGILISGRGLNQYTLAATSTPTTPTILGPGYALAIGIMRAAAFAYSSGPTDGFTRMTAVSSGALYMETGYKVINNHTGNSTSWVITGTTATRAGLILFPAPYLQLKVDWNNDADFLDTGEDLTNRWLPGGTSERGKDQARAISPPMSGRAAASVNNLSKDYSSHNSSSPLYGSVEPGRRFRIEAGATTVWTGFLDDVIETPDLGARQVTLSALGSLSTLIDRPITLRLYQNTRVDQAISNVLTAAGWTMGSVLSTADTTLDNFWVDNQTPMEALIALLNTEGAGASLYEDSLGRLVFENRNYRTTQLRSVASVHTFNATGEVATPFRPTNDFKDVFNICEIEIDTRAESAEQAIWALEQVITFSANETKEYIVHTSDPFVDALVPNAVPSNASQMLTPHPTLTSGTFKLTFRGQQTSSIAYNASAATIQAALEATPTIGPGNVACSGGPINTTPVLVVFIGALGGQDISEPDRSVGDKKSNQTSSLITVQSSLNQITVGGSFLEVQPVQDGSASRIEIQSLNPVGTLTAGTFTLSVTYSGGSGTTSSLNYNSTAAQIQTALRAIGGFGSTLCFGGPLNTTGVLIHFVNVTEDMALMTISGSGTLTVTGATLTVEQITKGGDPDYVLLSGSLVSKTLTETAGVETKLAIKAGTGGASLLYLRLRAKPLRVIKTEAVKNTNDTSASQTKYGKRPLSPGTLRNISSATAQTLANGYAAYYQRPRPNVDIRVPLPLSSEAQVFGREISDRITVVETWSGINNDYWIEQIAHEYETGDVITAVYKCEAAHGDAHTDTHTDTAHSDTAHGDVAHSDVAHADSHTDTAHTDAAHVDSGHIDVAHTDTHTDGAHTDSHTDDAHVDTHSDDHTDTAHSDSHTDSHTDTHADSHGDVFDPPFHSDTHIDSHADTHTDTHADVAAASAHSDAHSDTAHGDSHTDTAHSDSHTDTAHSDAVHGDSHGDTAHTDTHTDTHTDSHTDTAHSDVAHTDSHTDTHTDSP